MSAGNINILMQIMAAWQNSRLELEESEPVDPPFNSARHMQSVIDSIPRNPLEVMEGQIGNPDFKGEIDYAPKQVLGKDGKRQFTDMMSGDWSWEQAVSILIFI